jgi:hypothetical protein
VRERLAFARVPHGDAGRQTPRCDVRLLGIPQLPTAKQRVPTHCCTPEIRRLVEGIQNNVDSHASLNYMHQTSPLTFAQARKLSRLPGEDLSS